MSTKMFKVKWGASAPIEVSAEIPEYPNSDSDGDKIFVNTHFLTIKEAWPKLIAEVDAGVSLACMTVKRLKGELGTAESKLVDAAIARFNAVEKHEEWLRGAAQKERA